MLQLTQINIYPVKSLDGYSPTAAIVEKRGLQHDRRWMLTDTEGVFMTQRTNGKMALLQATVEDNVLIIREKQNHNNSIEIYIDAVLTKSNGEVNSINVQIWDDTVKAIRVSEEADTWLSSFLGKKCHLVTMPDTTDRRVDEAYNTGKDVVSFADGYPFLIIGEASMQELNTRLDTPLSIRRFRANFIFSGGEPFQEDDFKAFKIGDIDFIGVKNCARCVLITRDPDTGEKGKEPLQTLSTYRQQGIKTLFGQNVIWHHRQWAQEWQLVAKVGDLISQTQDEDDD